MKFDFKLIKMWNQIFKNSIFDFENQYLKINELKFEYMRMTQITNCFLYKC
jgi:hypothetical protein